METEKDPGFDGQHYLPWTLRTTPRDPIPDRSQLDPNWAVECQQQDAPIWNLITPSGLPFSLVSSCMQGSIRQGRVLESVQWTLEMLATDYKGGKAESNLLHRQAIITCEDIGLSNPYCVVAVAEFLTKKPTFNTYLDAQRAYTNITIMLARSMKSRAVDWACIARINVSEAFESTLYYNKLIENLSNGNHVMAIGYAEGFITQSLKDKAAKNKEPLSKLLFNQLSQGVTHRGKALKFYKNQRQLLWTAIMRVTNYVKLPCVTQIIEACYDLAHDDAFRWGIPSRLSVAWQS